MSEPAVSGETGPALGLEAALDIVFRELAAAGDPVFPRLEHEMVRRALAASGDDEAKAAHVLGLTKAALQKKRK